MVSQSRLGWIAFTWMVLTLMMAILPPEAQAGMRHRHAGHCGRCALTLDNCQCAEPLCGVCQHFPANCGCQSSTLQTQMAPFVTTVPRQEQVTTYWQHQHATLGLQPSAGSPATAMGLSSLQLEPISNSRLNAQTTTPEPYAPVVLQPQPSSPSAQPPASIAARISEQAKSVADNGRWSKVPTRQANLPATEIRQQSYEREVSPVSSARPSYSQSRQMQSGISRPVPTAATVWRSQGLTSRN